MAMATMNMGLMERYITLEQITTAKKEFAKIITNKTQTEDIKMIIENKNFRVALLFITGFLGVSFWFTCHASMRDFFGADAHVTGWVEVFMISFPVLFALWAFRTYDTRQQIEKAHEQIEQVNFTNGLSNLIKPDLFSVSLGVQMLIQVSHNTHNFDKHIWLAFIERIQKLPELNRFTKLKSTPYSISDPDLTYLPQIFEWIVIYAKKQWRYMDDRKVDVPNMDYIINELDSTTGFIDTDLSTKTIFLTEIKMAMDGYNHHQLKLKKDRRNQKARRI